MADGDLTALTAEQKIEPDEMASAMLDEPDESPEADIPRSDDSSGDVGFPEEITSRDPREVLEEMSKMKETGL